MTKSVATLSSNDPRVISFFNKYHESVISNPTLYYYGTDSIAVHLPRDLAEYSNASQGHMGEASGYQPRGIRRFVGVGNQESTLTKIFSSTDNLATFINSSECDAVEYFSRIGAVSKRIKRSKSVVKMDTRMAKDAIYAIHGEVKGFKILKGIRSAYFSTKERQTVMTKLFNETPIGEIELTYGNRNNNYDLSVYAE